MVDFLETNQLMQIERDPRTGQMGMSNLTRLFITRANFHEE